MSRTRWREHPVCIRETTCERINDLSANLVATWTSGSTNRSAQILRVHIVFFCQTLDSGEHFRRQRSAPAGVHCGKRASHRISEQNRNAIRCLNTGQHAFRIADNHIAIDRVAAFVLSRLRFLLRLDHAHVGAVNLPAAGERPVAGKKLEKPAPILQNVLRSVVVEAGQTQRIGRHRTDAAETRRETVNKTVLFEWRADESTYAFYLAPVKSCFV